ncbi:NEDD4-binding protein 2 [Solea senegalensis]|uniref:NEDD4-binding protein 2 n=2 Tax=Solea senegalensis TaxID=28829 RepID=A0AAV6Q966_SOLSE|nr:NEDD4-binding protein 2 [Solea senegalensis]KAG7485076.1 NEDD4-binding protein 2 [Solea senegalensis]
MPRRKKSSQSPARGPGGPGSEEGSLGYNTGNILPRGHDRGTREHIAESMQEMFSHLDPEVIYIVLSECDFKVENAMDSLLQLSEAAEVVAPIPSPISGFDRTAAALLSAPHLHKPRPDPDSSRPSQQPPSSPPLVNLLTDELDILVDQEMETLNATHGVMEEHHSGKYVSAGVPLSSFPPPSFLQQPLPELLQSSLTPRSTGFSAEQPCAERSVEESAPSAVNQLSHVGTVEKQKLEVDFTHLMTPMPADKLNPPLDLAASGRPSAFQVYKKQDLSHSLPETAGVLPSDVIVGGARSKGTMFSRESHGYMSWNLEAPAFSPHYPGNQGPIFITPRAQTTSNWHAQARQVSPWLIHAPYSEAPLVPSATIPKSLALSAAPRLPAHRFHLEGNVLVMIRGAPGSGKSTMARALLEHNPGGIILSTDDYFTRNGEYRFDPTVLGEAHEWNHKRAKDAFERGSNPIIIDNTNMQGWEMKPYVAQALKHRYKVLFREPDTWWKNKPRELERRSSHRVPVETIRRMLNGYERFVTVQSIMGSHMPESKQRLLLENKSSQLVSSEAPCPDLVGEPGLTEGSKKSRSQLCSSLPDVSSIGQFSEVGKLEDDTYRSTESLNFQLSGRPTENAEISNRDDDLYLGEIDCELNALLQMNNTVGDERIPDCIVESVMNEDHRGDEIPVAFSQSIGQRVRRERPRRVSGFDRMEPSDLVKDANQTENERMERGETIEILRDEEEREMSTILDFVGDWPSQGSLDQRQIRRERHKERNAKENDCVSQEVNEHEKKMQSGPDLSEFQKALDIIQTGVSAVESSSTHSSPLSLKSEEEKEVEACGRTEDSGSEEREQDVSCVNNSRGELPDCVLDWKLADSCRVSESRIDYGDEEELKMKKEASSTPEGNGYVPDNGRETSSSTNAISAESLVTLTTPEISKYHDAVTSHNDEGGVFSGPADLDTDNCTPDWRETGIKGDGSHISEVCQSLISEGSLEAEGTGSTASGASQERKQQRRRSGKQCKLALTFTQNCLGASLNTNESHNTTAHNMDSSLDSINIDITPSLSPNCNTSLNLKPDFEMFTESKSDTQVQPPSPPLPLEDVGCFTQTEPQDFAVLWRLNRRDSCDENNLGAHSQSSDFTVLYSDSFRFVPAQTSADFAAVAVHPFSHKEILYRVAHEKGTQVEEKELGGTHDRLESLCILSRHFKLVSFDTLEDLYDKCHQDLEWTTNLLLDSGERFFKDEDGEEEREEQEDDDGAQNEDDQGTSDLCGVLGDVETSTYPNVSNECHSKYLAEGRPAGLEEETERSPSAALSEPNESSNHVDLPTYEDEAAPGRKGNDPDTTSCSETDLQKDTRESDDTEHKVISAPDSEGGACGWSEDDDMNSEYFRDEIASLAEVQSVELKLPTELAIQLTELFGPVGVDPASCSTDDYAVQMDLNLAKLLHEKWKETIQERHTQATLPFHLLQESPDHRGESQVAKRGSREQCSQLPFMDHWNASPQRVSLRDIIKEEQALQKNVERTRQSSADLNLRDGSAKLKENKLFSLFPNIDRHFLQDIFRDHNYNLTQTELFLRSLLDEQPVKTVVAPEAPRSDHHRAASKEREKKQKPPERPPPNYQDVEDPEYDDFRAEACLQRKRQLENFAKAAEAYKQGRKEVASFYAQQGHLHGQQMRDANHRAAVQIFERVNSSLLPQNILDLHGLHVDEALQHLDQVLEEKVTDCEQGLCRPQLSVITGRGNHSQGGVARIRPAVIDYLTNKHYRFTEPKPGLVLVSLK